MVANGRSTGVDAGAKGCRRWWQRHFRWAASGALAVAFVLVAFVLMAFVAVGALIESSSLVVPLVSVLRFVSRTSVGCRLPSTGGAALSSRCCSHARSQVPSLQGGRPSKASAVVPSLPPRREPRRRRVRPRPPCRCPWPVRCRNVAPSGSTRSRSAGGRTSCAPATPCGRSPGVYSRTGTSARSLMPSLRPVTASRCSQANEWSCPWARNGAARAPQRTE